MKKQYYVGKCRAINGSYKLQSQSCLTNPVSAVVMGETPSRVWTKGCGCDHGSHSTIAFSKKALHQRDADENLFLRFLELDPPGDATVANRRQSTTKPSNGRTPFTITKKLTRTGESRGFGFSIVWTHPPRVEKVESGQCAERAGIWPGDYVIFVDKHNVVTMPEVDILNLIRSQGNSLTLEIFRRPAQQQRGNVATHTTPSTSHQTPVHVHSQASDTPSHHQNGPQLQRLSSGTQLAGTRSSIACSNASISAETTKRRLHLPQVTFSKESILPQSGDDQRRRYLYQLISREQHFVNALQFGMQRFTSPLRERKDLISPSDHRTLFQNIDELQRISEDILEQLVQDDMEPQAVNYASRVYMSKTTAICVAYKKYCNGLKRADCVLVNKSRHANSEFVKFITEPQVPRKRPDLTSFIHRPLQHFREVLKLIQVTTSHCRLDTEEYRNFSQVVLELQAAYREITVGGGLMEPLGEGKPLLTLQDLESRLVFTRCKPFVLASPGRTVGGDLSRVEGRSVKPYWTLLFSDILLFAKVSRDRVLFITEEPLPLVNITDSCFNIRKKSTEFRITIDPLGKTAESPTAHYEAFILRAPSPELKAVWQKVFFRDKCKFLVNAALGSTPLSSPLDSPDVMQSLIPLSSDIGAATTSMASIKLSSVDSLAVKSSQQQVRPSRIAASSCTSMYPKSSLVCSTIRPEATPATTSSISLSAIPEIVSEMTDLGTTGQERGLSKSYHEATGGEKGTYFTQNRGPKLKNFSMSSVGRSFIDESSSLVPDSVIQTPETPSANISPSSSNQFSETFSNYDFNLLPSTACAKYSPERHSSKRTESSCAGSWDLLELDLDFHQVNLDTSFGGDVEECVFFGDDPFGEPEITSLDASRQLEEFIDEKCRQMNKSGTPRGGALHLAQWMKGQLDQAISKHESERTALLSQSEPTESEPEDETIEEWTSEQVRKRSRELQLIDPTGRCHVSKIDSNALRSKDSINGGATRVDDLSGASEVEDESKSASRSTTSDSQ
uniref:Putative guanine nucleotide exchange factor n=1 Tax=Lutzomyia longipalpis TaxID=7200 RepID=A0A1B0C9I8_LUTLO